MHGVHPLIYHDSLITTVAKHTARRRKRRMGKYLRGSVDEELSLGTLAPVTLVSALFDETVDEKTLISSVVASWSLENFTQAQGDGPILIGLAHSNYSDAQIEEYIEASGSWNEGELIEQEISKRFIRRVGVFEGASLATEIQVLNDGKPIKTKLNWTLMQGQTLRLWAYNQGASALATTVPLVKAAGHANLWLR